MLFTATIATAVLLSVVTAAPTNNHTLIPRINGINLDQFTANGDHVAWFSGHPQSDYTDIGPSNVNPCSRTFYFKTSDGGTTGPYQEFGCGNSDYGINKNGAFYATCVVLSEPDADGVHSEWHCS
ncbi:hypothetical protein MVEN_00166400 [Mycena venus]|uniref:Uncharacterized protein n=1 Tax=Mycena venus TaxID=2733690 RepID=A0A8H6Z0Z8_9AGAR|nr:hypothetical protein MVEN_00166400 [Mycena venus]